MRKLLLISLALFYNLIVFGQSDKNILIETRVLPNQELVTCRGEVEFEVKFTNRTKNKIVTKTKYTSDLATGVYYVASDYKITSKNNNTKIEFEFPDIAVGQTVTITYKAKADCEVLASFDNSINVKEFTVKNSNLISYSLNNQSPISLKGKSESYNVYFPQLEAKVADSDVNLFAQVIEKDADATVFKRKIEVRNSGLGPLSEFKFHIDIDSKLGYRSLRIVNADTLSPVSSGVSPLSPKFTRYTYKINSNAFKAIGNTNNLFEQNEVIHFVDEVSMKSYDLSLQTNYTVDWGCNSKVCNKGDKEATSVSYIGFSKGGANLKTNARVIKSFNYCNPGAYNVEVSNDSPKELKYTVFDVGFRTNFYSKPTSAKFTLQGKEIPIVTTNTNHNYFSLHGRFKEDPDGDGIGLEDVDKDGFYDDLPPGNKLVLGVDYGLFLPSNTEAFNINRNFLGIDFYSKLNDNSYRGLNLKGIRIYTWTNSPNIVLPEEVTDNELHKFKFVINRGSGRWNLQPSVSFFKFGDFYSEFQLPERYVIEEVNWVYSGSKTKLNVQKKGDKYRVRGGNYRGHYEIIVKVNCATNSYDKIGKVRWNMYRNGCEGINPLKPMLIESKSASIFTSYTKCKTDGEGGPGGGSGSSCVSEITSFDINRNTFGYVTPAKSDARGRKYYTHKELLSAPKVNKNTSGINLKLAHPLDEVEVIAEGILRATKPNVYSEVYFEFAYNKTSGNDKGLFAHKKNGTVSIGGKNYNLGKPIISSSDDRITYKFKLSNVSLPSNSKEAPIKVSGIILKLLPISRLPQGLHQLKLLRAKIYGKESGTSCIKSKKGVFGISVPSVNIIRNYWSVYPRNLNLGYSQIAAVNGRDYFPNEFRPALFLEKVKFNKPEQYKLIEKFPVYARSDIGVRDYTKLNKRKTYNEYYFDDVAVYDIGSWNKQNFLFYLNPVCDKNFKIFRNGHRLGGNQIFYKHLLENPNSTRILNSAPPVYLNANIEVKPNTTQEGYERYVSWPIQICNRAGWRPNVRHFWVAVELKGNDTRTKLEGAYVVDRNGKKIDRDVIFYGKNAIGNPKGMLVKIGNLSRRSCISPIYPKVSYSNCVNDAVQAVNVYTSWDYFKYPLVNYSKEQLEALNSIKDDGVLSCEYKVQENELILRYKTGDLSWEVNRLKEKVDLCEKMPYEVKVVSSKYANVYDTELTINLPRKGVSVSIDTISNKYNIKYQYNGKSGIVPVKFLDNSNILSPKIKVSDLVSNLLGYTASESTIPGSRLVGKNEIKFTVDLVADCNIDVGDPVNFSLKGVTNCNDKVSLKFTRFLPIKGVPLPTIDLKINAENFLSCSNKNEVSIKFVNKNSVNVLQQKIKMVLPKGVNYAGVVNGYNAPTQKDNNTLVWDIDNPNVDKSQTFKIYTTLEDSSKKNLTYLVSSIQKNFALCKTNERRCELQSTTAKDSIKVTAIPSPKVTINSTNKFPICKGEQVDVDVNVEGVTDYSNYTFRWNVKPVSEKGNKFTFVVQNSTKLEVLIAKGIEGTCSSRASMDVEVYPGATIYMNLVEGVTCSPKSDGKATIKVVGGTGKYSTQQKLFEVVSVSPSGLIPLGKKIKNGELLTVDNLPYGPFFIALKDGNGCVFKRTLNIPYVNNPIRNLCTTVLPCGVASGDVTLNFKTQVSHSQLKGKKYKATISSNNSGKEVHTLNGVFSDNHSINLSDLKANGLYTLKLDVEGGCTYSKYFVVRNYRIFAGVVTNNDPNFYKLCYENETKDVTISISDNNPVCSTFKVETYKVTFGEVDNLGNYIGNPEILTGVKTGTTFTSLGEGNYKAMVTAEGNAVETKSCQTELKFSLKSDATFKVNLKTKNPLCSGQPSGSAYVIINGGSGAFQYQWKKKNSNEILSKGYSVQGLKAGVYEVLVKDNKSCLGVNPKPIEFEIKDPIPLDVPFIEDVQTACEAKAGLESNGKATGYSSGTAPYSFKWYEVKTHQDEKLDENDKTISITRTSLSLVFQQVIAKDSISVYKNIRPGKYQVIVTDRNGCEIKSVVTEITQPDVEREYNLCIGWESPHIKEVEATPTKLNNNTPIAASNIRKLISAKVEKCVVESQEAIKSTVEEALRNPDLLKDKVKMEYYNNEDVYHFTLYYHDRAGNLVRTVPPSGVTLTSYGNGVPSREPTEHTYVTGYNYNSLAQLQSQNTPDGGTTNFLYNNIGQLLYSQNERQIDNNSFSYSIYDKLGRVVEAGEAKLNGKVFPDNFVVNKEANPEVALQIVEKDKLEFLKTTYNDKAKVYYLGEEQRYLRNRVSYISSLDKNGATTNTYYSYDPHGNVEWIIQNLPSIGKTSVAYSYDLISGNVNEVVYNKGKVDEYHHKYTYDEDNRIVSVKTSKDGHLWDEDARYDYYLHGPLARTELGEDNIQGLDFTYTIHGWLKGINTPNLKKNAYNPDGKNIAGANNKSHAPDEFGMSLNYYDGDFKRNGIFDSRLTANNPFILQNKVDGIKQNLYNGNISVWTSQIAKEAKEKGVKSYLTGNTYRYDQLNRIKESKTKVYDESSKKYTTINRDSYAFRTAYEYDGNGNLQRLERYKDDGVLMDDLEYHYDLSSENMSNKLLFVKDYSGQVSKEINDLPNQFEDNYVYDKIGQLIRDESEGLTYEWNNSGKVSEIVPDFIEDTEDNKQKVHMKFTYDGLGNRIVKYVNREPYDEFGDKLTITNPESVEVTYYSRDAQGNVMSVYKREDKKVSKNEEDKTYKATFKVIERPIYGSDRLGQDTKQEIVFTKSYEFNKEADFNAIMLSFVETIDSYAYGNVVVAQNETQTLSDKKGNTINVIGTNVSIASVKGNFANITYSSTIAQNEGSTPIKTSNNLFIIEGENEKVLGYGVVTDNYFSAKEEEGVMLIYNNEGKLISGLEIINNDTSENIDPLAKSVVVNNPANINQYYLFYRDVKGGLNRATIVSDNGKLTVTAVQKQQFTNYGRHLAVVQDKKHKKSYVYATMHTKAIYDANDIITTPPKANIVRFIIDETGKVTEEGAVTESFESYDVLGNGELQIALDGSAITLYNSASFPKQLVEASKAEILTWKLNKDTWLPNGNTLDKYEIGYNIGKGSLLNTGDEIYYTQRTHYQTKDKQTKFVKRISDKKVIATTVGDLRANKNDNIYQFAAKTNTGKEWNKKATTQVSLTNLPKSTAGVTGYQPYQPYTIKAVKEAATQGIVYRTVGKKQYELKDHLGNVRVVVSDRKDLNTKDNTLSAHVEAYNNYYPFGMEQPNRNYTDGTYRYGFQGQEKDNELKGKGNSVNYKYRMHDSRLGRFFAVDPLAAKYPWNSTYAFSENRVVDGLELEGAEYLNYNESRIYVNWGATLVNTKNTDGWTNYHLNKMGISEVGSVDFGYSNVKYDFNSFQSNHYKQFLSDAGGTLLQKRELTHKANLKFTGYGVNVKWNISGGFKNSKANFLLAGIELGNYFLANKQKNTINKDLMLIKEHAKIYNDYVIPALNKALSMGNTYIPKDGKYRNDFSLSMISNAILYGEKLEGYEELYDIGIEIFKDLGEPLIRNDNKGFNWEFKMPKFEIPTNPWSIMNGFDPKN